MDDSRYCWGVDALTITAQRLRYLEKKAPILGSFIGNHGNEEVNDIFRGIIDVVEELIVLCKKDDALIEELKAKVEKLENAGR